MIAALIALLLGGAAFALAGGGGGSGSPGAEPLDDRDDRGEAPEPEPSAIVIEGPDTGTDDIPDSAYTLNWGGLTPEEQLIVELINRARLDPRSEVNRLDEPIASGGNTTPQEALAVVPELSIAARDHSSDMDDRNFFDHVNPDRDDPGDRAVDAGYAHDRVGENIAVIGSSWTGFDQQARAEQLHENLWESDGHQVNMLRSQYSEIGVGYDYGNWEGYAGSTFVTEKFADTGKTYLTGVVIEDGDGDRFYDMGEGQGGVRVTAIDADDNVYTTSTWDAGGYTLALPPGTYRVVFEGGDLDAPQEAEVVIGNENVKLDIIDEGTSETIVSASLMAEPAADDGASLPWLPPVEEDALADDLDDDELPEPALL